ncbi:proteasome regulatory particle base subunit rpn10 [Lecanora helva]
MVLEATMIVLDNSESSRNGDYVPSRWEAQADAVNLIFSAKTQANPESSVGLMNMAGKGPEMLVTLTTDFGKLLEGMHRTKIRGSTHLATAIQIAGLALKHRQNKSQRQRIIVFTCSPIGEDEKNLVKLARKMKKNNVSIDFIAFGDLDSENTKKLEAFNENIKGGDGSHLEIIPPGPSLLSDHIISTPILAGEGVAPRGGDTGGEGGGDTGGGGFDFGVDPSTDPELALALRMSMEEEKARQEKEGASGEGANEPTLEGIPEEGGENQPLLNADGEASGSADAPVTKPEEEEKKDKEHPTDLDKAEGKKDEDRDPDTMDTA